MALARKNVPADCTFHHEHGPRARRAPEGEVRPVRDAIPLSERAPQSRPAAHGASPYTGTMGPRSKPALSEAELANAEIVGARVLEDWDNAVTVEADAYLRWVESGEGDDPCPDFSE